MKIFVKLRLISEGNHEALCQLAPENVRNFQSNARKYKGSRVKRGLFTVSLLQGIFLTTVRQGSGYSATLCLRKSTLRHGR